MPSQFETKILVRCEGLEVIRELALNHPTILHWHEAHRLHGEISHLAGTLARYDASDLVMATARELQQLLWKVKKIDNAPPMIELEFEDEPHRLPIEFELYAYQDAVLSKRRTILQSSNEYGLYLRATTLDGSHVELEGSAHVEIPHGGREKDIWVDIYYSTVGELTEINPYYAFRKASLEISDVAYADDLPEEELDKVLSDYFQPAQEPVAQ